MSYDEVVGFHEGATGKRVISQNAWTKTTGCHLTKIDGGSPEAKRPAYRTWSLSKSWTSLQQNMGIEKRIYT